MILTGDRQNYLVRKITDSLLQNKLVSYLDKDFLFQKVRIGLSQFLREWEEIDRSAIQKIQSIKRGVIPGSSEWDVLYMQYFEENFKKKSSSLVKK